MRALEEERERQEKRQRQDDNRATLDFSLKLKMKKKAREVQEELALDMKILQQMLTETNNETMEKLQRKVFNWYTAWGMIIQELPLHHT